MEAVKCFPKTSRLILRDTTMAITAAPTSFEDSTGRLQHRSMERQLARHALRMCTCGDAPLSQDIKFVLAFKGKNLQIGAPTSASAVSKAGGTASCSPEIVWVVHQVTERINGSWECITGKSYLLSCFSKEGADQIGMDSQDQCRRMSTMLFKYEADAELTITRTDDGWLTLHERTFIAAGAVLAHSTSINAGMKCRCRARGVSLAGSARNHSYGPFVVEIKKQIMGCSMKCGRNKGALDTDVLWMPPVGDERMIRLLDALFSGIEIDFDAVGRDFFSSSSPSSSGTVSKHRAAAAFVWNNLLGGKMLFAGVEARLQPWALLLPSLTASMTGPQKVREVAALALLDQMRRTVEAYLLLERGSLIRGQLPSFISRDSIVELRCPGRNKLAV